MNMYRTIINAKDLQRALKSAGIGSSGERATALVVLDCRAKLGDAAAGPAAWAAGHIPGAQHANLETDLARPAHSLPGAGGGRHPLPTRKALADCCARWGISTSTQVVAYDDAGGAYAARAWWLLRWLGHENVAVLNGGISAWLALPDATLSTKSEPHETAQFQPTKPLTKTATLEDVAVAVAGQEGTAQEGTVLLDARAQQRFDGEMEPIDPVAGHIPGAHCFAHSGNLGDDGLFLSGAELSERFATAANASQVICYCGSGVTAAHNVLAMRIAGLPEPKLYVGSWSEWSADSTRPRSP